jgi:hypothetical protein
MEVNGSGKPQRQEFNNSRQSTKQSNSINRQQSTAQRGTKAKINQTMDGAA